MTYRISKDFHLSYSHQLGGLPDGHPCGRLHGHNAVVRVTLEAADHRLRAPAFVLDYGDLKPLGNFLDRVLDHQHLNDIVDWEPTAENLARYLYDWCNEMHPEWPVVEVAWSETPKTWASYQR